MSSLLLAVDLNDLPPDLLPEAVAWANRLGARLDLLYSGLYGEVERFVRDPHVRRMLQTETENARAADLTRLQELLQTIPQQNRGTAHVLDGEPHDCITTIEDAYDAVLVGTHGRTGLARAFLGSVAERIVRASKRPVLVLRTQPAA